LISAVEKRCCTTERPIACLLSGGLDSSLIAALVNEYHNKNNLPKLETYSIGIKGSEDLKYAKIVAEHLGTKHTEIVLTEEEFISSIPEVIYAIESYDTTTVRASIGNWLLGKYISNNSQAKVIFNGDGSDEMSGGYLYMHYAEDAIEFDKECRRLLKDIHMFDVLRSDKSISSNGLEPRTPFLDRSFVQNYMSIPYEIRYQYNKIAEKYLIRYSFVPENFRNREGKELLPHSILWRKKEAFSDGITSKKSSLYEKIQEYTNKLNINTNKNVFEHLTPKTNEQLYYRNLFEEYYSGSEKLVPYFWMPKYVHATDASARTLPNYDCAHSFEPETTVYI
jgi:asparagine synthase (glutamine-hydrolysing)